MLEKLKFDNNKCILQYPFKSYLVFPIKTNLYIICISFESITKVSFAIDIKFKNIF